MSQAVEIETGVEKDKTVLKQRLRPKELLEQYRLAFTESLKNHPEEWLRISIAISAGVYIDEWNNSKGVDGTLPALLTSAAVMSPDPQPLLIAAGLVESGTLLSKVANVGIPGPFHAPPGATKEKGSGTTLTGRPTTLAQDVNRINLLYDTYWIYYFLTHGRAPP